MFFLFFKTCPQLLQSFRTMLQDCFAVKFQQCFVDWETVPELYLFLNAKNLDSVVCICLHFS